MTFTSQGVATRVFEVLAKRWKILSGVLVMLSKGQVIAGRVLGMLATSQVTASCALDSASQR